MGLTRRSIRLNGNWLMKLFRFVTLLLVVSLLTTQAASAAPTRVTTEDLVAWWALNEPGGPRPDSHSSHWLTDVNTVGATTGVQGNAASFIAANNEYMTLADRAELSITGTSFSIAMWLNLTNLTSGNPLLVIRQRTGNTGWYVEISNATNVPSFLLYNGSQGFSRGCTTFGALSTSAWYFLGVSYDSPDNTFSCAVNLITDTSAFTGTPADAATPFRLSSSDAANQFTGALDEVGFWRRTLSTSEWSALYNGGQGITYFDLDLPTTELTPTPNIVLYDTLPSGNAFAIERSATFGEIAIGTVGMAGVALVFVLFLSQLFSVRL